MPVAAFGGGGHSTPAAPVSTATTTITKATAIATPLPSNRISLKRSAFIRSSLRIPSPSDRLDAKHRRRKGLYEQYDPHLQLSRDARDESRCGTLLVSRAVESCLVSCGRVVSQSFTSELVCNARVLI